TRKMPKTSHQSGDSPPPKRRRQGQSDDAGPGEPTGREAPPSQSAPVAEGKPSVPHNSQNVGVHTYTRGAEIGRHKKGDPLDPLHITVRSEMKEKEFGKETSLT
ncbi:hypothetical protein BaRGS_00030859, partial [Batillaria attramentaria]